MQIKKESKGKESCLLNVNVLQLTTHPTQEINTIQYPGDIPNLWFYYMRLRLSSD